MKILSVF